MDVTSEARRRRRMWKDLEERGGPNNVSPQALRDLRIYGGAQGIWVDAETTRDVSNDAFGVTVSVLHTGQTCPDDLTASLVRYHYPRTQRPPKSLFGDIEATKNAARLGLPVFVIVRQHSSRVRDVNFGWVEEWDDNAEIFTIVFDSDRDRAFLNPTRLP